MQDARILFWRTFTCTDAVSNALDALNFDEVLGTVAGDNCIFACLKEGVSGEQFLSILKDRIPEIEV